MRIESGCMDCDHREQFNTISEALMVIGMHCMVWPDHRPLVSDNSGWHRAWLNEHEKWFLSDGVRVEE